MKIVVRRAAKRDLAAARDWYDERQPGLSDAFRLEVDAALQSIRERPEMNPRVDARIRRAALHRFPYGVFHILDGQTIRVIAILHRARNPARWRRRT